MKLRVKSIRNALLVVLILTLAAAGAARADYVAYAVTDKGEFPVSYTHLRAHET